MPTPKYGFETDEDRARAKTQQMGNRLREDFEVQRLFAEHSATIEEVLRELLTAYAGAWYDYLPLFRKAPITTAWMLSNGAQGWPLVTVKLDRVNDAPALIVEHARHNQLTDADKERLAVVLEQATGLAVKVLADVLDKR